MALQRTKPRSRSKAGKARVEARRRLLLRRQAAFRNVGSVSVKSARAASCFIVSGPVADARMPVSTLRNRSWNFRTWPAWYDADDPDFMVPIVYAPEDFIITVAGDYGRLSVWLPS